MITQDEFDGAVAEMQKITNFMSKHPGMDIQEQLMFSAMQAKIKKVLQKGMEPTSAPTITQAPYQPDTEDVSITRDVRAFEKLTPAEQTAKINEVLRIMVTARSTLSGLLKQSDKAVISFNTPAIYKQTVFNVNNQSEETVKLIFSTATNAYMITESPTRGLSISLAKYWSVKKPT